MLNIDSTRNHLK